MMTKFFVPFGRNIFLLILPCVSAIMGCYISIPVSVGDPQPVPAVYIPASDLLLDNQSFPTGWRVLPCDPDCDDAERADIARRDFVGTVDRPGAVVQDVFHFANEEDALAKFERYEETDALLSPLEITYRSPFADKQYVYCKLDNTPGCSVGLQYDTYFIYFYLHIDDGSGYGLELEEVEPVLRAMDQRVSELFDMPLVP